MHVHCTFTSTQTGEPILYLFKSQFELCHNNNNNNNNNKNNNNNTLPLSSKGFSGIMKQLFNPFAPEPPGTARADPGPFYPL